MTWRLQQNVCLQHSCNTQMELLGFRKHANRKCLVCSECVPTYSKDLINVKNIKVKQWLFEWRYFETFLNRKWEQQNKSNAFAYISNFLKYTLNWIHYTKVALLYFNSSMENSLFSLLFFTQVFFCTFVFILGKKKRWVEDTDKKKGFGKY